MIWKLVETREQVIHAHPIDILKSYMRIERTLSFENRVTRLATLSKLLFDEEINAQCQQAILNYTNSLSKAKCQQALDHMVHDMT